MKDREISKWEIRYNWILTYLYKIKQYFKRFSKKGREELAYSKQRSDQIYEMIINYDSESKDTIS